MIQRFLLRYYKAWWLIPTGLGFAAFGIIDGTAWWALTLGSGFLAAGLATWVQDRDQKLEEQRKKNYQTPQSDHRD